MASIVNSDKQSEISLFQNIEEMSGAFFHFLVDEFAQALSENRSYHLALSGGSTPIAIFKRLSSLPLSKMKWEFLHVYWGDERCVPPDNPESNFGNMWNTILKKIEIPKENIHRIHGENEPHFESLRYSNVLKKIAPFYDGFPRFDLSLLGIGEDGHTASIFPGSLFLADTDEICYPAIHPQTHQKRVTLSLKVLNNSKIVLFLVTGASKAEIISTVINKKSGVENLPSAYIKPETGILKWFLDSESGKNLLLNKKK